MPELVGATPSELHMALCSVVGYSKRGLVLMGKILKELKDDSKFKNAIGYGIDNWEDYLKQPEIGLSKNEADRMIQVYQEMVLRLGYTEETVSEIPTKNMFYLLPIAKKADEREEIDDLVADATILSQKDFRRRIQDKAEDRGVTEFEYEFMVMRKNLTLGTMDRVPGIKSDLIINTFNLENYGKEKDY